MSRFVMSSAWRARKDRDDLITIRRSVDGKIADDSEIMSEIERLEAELAKREKALRYLADACEAKLIPVVTWDNTPAGESIKARRTININAQNAPELAEWLKSRRKK